MAEIRNARLITKRTSISGKIPTGTTGDESSFIRAGELASNLADHSLWGYDGMNVFEYGSSSYLGLTGGTISGNLVVNNLSSNTISSGSTDLYSIFAKIGDIGEINTASSVGVGNSIFKQKNGTDLQFRSFSAGTNITIITGDTITINSTSSGGGSSRITNLTTTTNATPTTIATISTTTNSTQLIEVYIKAFQTSATNYGIWRRTLAITNVSGIPTIQATNSDVTKTSSGLKATSITFSVSGSNILVQVTGIAATTINWNSAYEIIL